MDNSHFTLLQIDTLDCQQKQWDTKEDKNKFMMREFYILWFGLSKGTVGLK